MGAEPQIDAEALGKGPDRHRFWWLKTLMRIPIAIENVGR